MDAYQIEPDRDDLIDALREDLVVAGYSVDRLSSLWGEDAAAALYRDQRLPAARALRTHPGEPIATLARAFVLGLPVRRQELEAALPALGAAGALELGLVGQAGRGGPAGLDDPHDAGGAVLTPRFDLRPYSFRDERGAGAWWILSDLGESVLRHRLPEDHVLGVGGASLTLSGMLVPRAAGLALDLGTGCGIQALHLARQAERVVATDISERAIRVARFNAALNRAGNIEFRRGSLFEPVVGERFDLIVSNPPFVITPRSDGVPLYDYRDGGMVGDELVRAVVGGAARHLAPGGIAQFLGNWEYREIDGPDRVQRWIDDADRERASAGSDPAGRGILDSWLIEREVLSAPEYAETWIRDGGTRPGDPEFDALYAAWLEDFETRKVRAVGLGYLLLRRRAARDVAGSAPLRRQESLPEAVGRNETGLGAHLARCLELFDWQSERDDRVLAGESLLLAPDVSEERHFRPGEEDPSVIVIRQGGGFGRSVRADTALAAFLGACDGSLPVGAISDAIAELLGADPLAVRADVLPRIRSLVDAALLTPA